MPPLDNRPTATYPGDVTTDVGRVVDPTLAGEYLTLDEATYDPDTDRTTARFRYATPEDTADAARLPLHFLAGAR